ncbi:hypothetical protein [Tumebacillus sp. BK434]|uniref:hypothetical protein n=1 Tax=Tumebacillus sp. BK434 TaxID=2512169 RepID=UPI0010517A13|nr:hypothetical protein [Tumebacillus sp. BK434]
MTVVPLGEAGKWKNFWSMAGVYSFTTAISGAVFGFLYVLLIYLLSFWLPTTVKAIGLGILVIAYVCHEFGLIRLVIPQRQWQIPETWVQFTPQQNMLVWGSILGAGILTYIPHVTFYMLYLYLGFFGEPYQGLLFGAVYGLTRALPTVWLWYKQMLSAGEQADTRDIMRLRRRNGVLNGLSLLILLALLYAHSGSHL